MNNSDLLNRVGTFAAPLALEASGPEEVVRIGAAFLAVAETIFRSIGGDELAAVQFYAAADRCAAAKPCP